MNAINWFYLTGSWILNFFDLLLFYLIVSSLVDQRLKLTVKKCGFKLIYAVAMGSLAHFVGILIHQAVLLIAMFCVIRFITKKVADTRSVADNILLLAVSYLTGLTLNLMTFLLVSLTGLTGMWSMLIACPISVMIFFFLRQRVDFNGLFLLIIDRISLKLLFFVLFLTFILTFAITSFDSFALWEHIILFFVLGIGSVMILFPVIQAMFIRQLKK